MHTMSKRLLWPQTSPPIIQWVLWPVWKHLIHNFLSFSLSPVCISWYSSQIQIQAYTVEQNKFGLAPNIILHYYIIRSIYCSLCCPAALRGRTPAWPDWNVAQLECVNPQCCSGTDCVVITAPSLTNVSCSQRPCQLATAMKKADWSTVMEASQSELLFSQVSVHWCPPSPMPCSWM